MGREAFHIIAADSDTARAYNKRGIDKRQCEVLGDFITYGTMTLDMIPVENFDTERGCYTRLLPVK